MILGTPIMPSPVMIPDRAIYIPEQPRVIVSMIRRPIDTMFCCVELELLVEWLVTFVKDVSKMIK